MFHLALFDASVSSAAANQQIAAVADPLLAPAGTNGLLVNSVVPKIMRIAGVSNLLMRAALTSGSLRDFAQFFDIAPVNVGTIIASPARRLDFTDAPIDLSANEEIDAFITNSGAGATRSTVAVWFCDGQVRPVKGRFFSMHWTVTQTMVANAWTGFTPVLDNGLPSGTFAVVGSRCKGVSGMFHRFIPRGNSAVRPGTFSTQGDGDFQDAADRYGNLGEWFRFSNTNMPQIEAFCRAADTVAEGFIDLIKVG